MKVFTRINKDGMIEVSKEDLNSMLLESYREGYADGQIDKIIRDAPSFDLSDNHESAKKQTFSTDGTTLIFRATIL